MTTLFEPTACRRAGVTKSHNHGAVDALPRQRRVVCLTTDARLLRAACRRGHDSELKPRR
jgi:hypothetical protein